eukprot:COSAG01_NODE_8662_length_2705_cov_1.176899_1_plen_80_part_00
MRSSRSVSRAHNPFWTIAECETTPRPDLIRTAIISKKINETIFKDDSIQDLKVQFYHLMIQKDAKDKVLATLFLSRRPL